MTVSLGNGVDIGNIVTSTTDSITGKINYTVGGIETDLVDSNTLLLEKMSLSEINALKYDYFVSTSGNDTNNGLTLATAWKSLSKINSMALVAGATKSILVKSGTYDTALDYIRITKDTHLGATVNLVFESGCTMDGTLANPVSGSNIGGIEADGDQAWTLNIYGNGLNINNYHDSSAGTSPNGIGCRGDVSVFVYSVNCSNCDDGFSSHETSKMYLYDCTTTESEKAAYSIVDSSYFEAWRSTFTGGGSSGIGGVSSASSASQNLYDCILIPSGTLDTGDKLEIQNGVFTRCVIGTLTVRVKLMSTYSGIGTFDSCFINIWNDGNINTQYRKCFGLFTVRLRGGVGVTLENSVIQGPATSKAAVLLSDNDFGTTSPIILNNNIFIGAITFDSLTNSTYASRLFDGVDSELIGNLLYGGAAYSAILTTANTTYGGDNISGTLSSNPNVVGGTYSMGDYSTTINGPGFTINDIE